MKKKSVFFDYSGGNFLKKVLDRLIIIIIIFFLRNFEAVSLSWINVVQDNFSQVYYVGFYLDICLLALLSFGLHQPCHSPSRFSNTPLN